jgi:hypothetical protein
LTSHDQLSKSLIKIFLAEFLGLIDPESASLLRAGEAIFLDKEDFTDWPVGDRREMDLVARVPVVRKERRCWCTWRSRPTSATTWTSGSGSTT